jgi:hypothetical protein
MGREVRIANGLGVSGWGGDVKARHADRAELGSSYGCRR